MPVNSFENYPMSWKPKKADLKSPYYLSLADSLEKDIRSQKLPADTKLPPQRELADYLDLNVGTITRAYKLCELKGLLYAVTGRGTFVSPGIFAQDTFLDQNSDWIEMGMIKPFYETNPIVQKSAQLVLSRPETAKLLAYNDPFGTKHQLKAAQKWLRRLGIHTDTDHILLSAGAQNALSVILVSLFKAGDKIAADTFTYTNFKGLANFLHIQLIAVPGDEQGMSPQALLQLCKNTQIKGIYLMPTCSNPTGIFMPASRRLELAEIIQQYGLLVIEDDIYSFLAPDRTESFFSLVPWQTVHVCSTSKSLCAGLRVAFLAFPTHFKALLEAGMLHINLKAVSINSEIIAELIENGQGESIIAQKINLANKRNRIFASVFCQDHAPNIPQFFHWLKLPPHLTSEELEIIALQRGIHLLGSHRFALQKENKSAYARISVTSPQTEDDLQKGLWILKSILEQPRPTYFV